MDTKLQRLLSLQAVLLKRKTLFSSCYDPGFCTFVIIPTDYIKVFLANIIVEIEEGKNTFSQLNNRLLKSPPPHPPPLFNAETLLLQ